MLTVAEPKSEIRTEAATSRLGTEVRGELVDYFEEVGRALRLPPSIGRIYGLLFAAAEPLSFDEITTQLALSKGAVSQGLHTLEEMKAITPTKVAGDRRTFFRPETRLRHLTQTFLSDVMAPRLEAGRQKIDTLESRLETAGEGDDIAHLADRLQSLRIWQKKLQRLLPWIARLAAPSGSDKPGKAD